MHTFFSKTARGALLVLALNGCASSRNETAAPMAEMRADGRNFAEYVNETNQLCSLRESQSLLGREETFHRYILWLSQISQTPFDLSNFSIIPENNLLGFVHSGVPGLFAPSGMYWFGTIYQRGSGLTLPSLAHEFGHVTDTKLEYLEYAFSRDARIRAEAVSEAFELYANVELLKEGVTSVESQFSSQRPNLPSGRTMEDILEDENRYKAARILTYVFLNEFDSIRDVWRYLLATDEDDVYERARNIEREKGGLARCVQTGHDKYILEVRRAKGESITQ